MQLVLLPESKCFTAEEWEAHIAGQQAPESKQPALLAAERLASATPDEVPSTSAAQVKRSKAVRLRQASAERDPQQV